MTHFAIFHPYDIPTFRTKALCLASSEGQLKCFLLLYKRLIQISLFWLLPATDFVTRVTPIDDIDSKCHKMELKSSRNYSTNHLMSKIKPLIIYGLGGEHAHAHTRTHTHTHTHTHTYFSSMRVISRNQARAGLWLAHTWFNNAKQ